MTDTPEHHRRRSEFIRKLVQRSVGRLPINAQYVQSTPRTIVQFWHDLQQLPGDVEECIASWTRWTSSGFAHRLFDEGSAKAFIGASLDARHEHAFERCYHPAMQADYFRLCYLLVEGGFYVDADDVCVGTLISAGYSMMAGLKSSRSATTSHLERWWPHRCFFVVMLTTLTGFSISITIH